MGQLCLWGDAQRPGITRRKRRPDTRKRLSEPRGRLRACETCGAKHRKNALTCSALCAYLRRYDHHSVLLWQRCSCGSWWIANNKQYHCPTVCELCGREFKSRILTRRFCNERHRWLYYRYNGQASSVTYGVCRRCGKAFVRRTGMEGGYCGERCRRRTDKRIRATRKRTNGIHPQERYTLRQVADRDGWRCHICHKRVPDRPYRGRSSDPTIDHLVPLSAGGSDTRVNVALAHNRCNGRRGTTGPAQLQAFG